MLPRKPTVFLFSTFLALLAGWAILPSRVQSSAHKFAPDFVTGALNLAREGHTATLLQNGKVLVAGGRNGTLVFNSAELYDPATGAWTNAPNFTNARFGHSAVLLRNGQVLIIGGQNLTGALDSAELYDPNTNAWQPTFSSKLNVARARFTATLLNTGRVLIAGGLSGAAFTRSAELYDPGTRNWAPLPFPLVEARAEHTATLLSDGRVLVAGGLNAAGSVKTAELFEPSTNRWRRTGDPLTPRRQATATRLPNGLVLLAGGANGAAVLNACELYDPAKGVWTQTSTLELARRAHTATLLPNGLVVVTGGADANGRPVGVSESFDSSENVWIGAAQAPPFTTQLHTLAEARSEHTATLLPNGQLLLAGGLGGANNIPLRSAELYEYATGLWELTRNTAGAATQMLSERAQHTATLLPTGRVLVAGGLVAQIALNTAELYDPVAGAWAATGALNTSRFNHTATLLANGRVLVVGGQTANQTAQDNPELYDPATGVWTRLTPSGIPRYAHTATLLRNGQVLIAGGVGAQGQQLRSAQIYDPTAGAADAWRTVQDLPQERSNHTATLLPDGTVFVFGGKNTDKVLLNSAALYSANGVWTTRTFGNFPPLYRWAHTATLLANNRLLIAGGLGGQTATDVSGLLTQAEIYNHTTGLFETARPVTGSRFEHTATLLPSGKVLLAGGRSIGVAGQPVCPNPGATPKALLFDPSVAVGAATSVVQTGNPLQMRNGHTATLLPSGEVLWAGGLNEELRPACVGAALKHSELFEPGLNFREEWRPGLAFVAGASSTMTLFGVQFQGVSEAGGGEGASSAGNYPVAQLFSLSNEQTLFVPVAGGGGPVGGGWTNNTYSFNPVGGFAPGLALLTVYANGIPSRARVVLGNGGGFNLVGAQPLGSISGRVILHNIAGFPVTLTFAPAPNAPRGCSATRTINNAPNGEFSFRDLVVTPDGSNFCRYQVTPNATGIQFFPTSALFTMTANGGSAAEQGEAEAATAPDQSGPTCLNCINNTFVARGPFWQLGGNVRRPDGMGVADVTLEFSVPYEIFDDRLTCMNGAACTPGTLTVVGDPCAKTSTNPLITDAAFKCACTTLRNDGVCEKTVLARPTPTPGTGGFVVNNVPNGANAVVTPFNLPAGTQYSFSVQPLAPPNAALESFLRIDQMAQSYDDRLITANTSPCNFALTPTVVTVPVGGGANAVSLTGNSQCNWSAVSNSNWLTITAGSAGSGGGVIGFTATANTNAAARAGTLTIAGLTFTVTQNGTGTLPPVTSVSAASFFADRQAPDSIVAAFGLKLATGRADATTVPLPDTLLGTFVNVRDSANVTRRAPLFFVAPQQVNFLLPPQTALGLATVTITTGDNVVSAGQLQVERIAPGVFSANANGTGVPAAVLLRVPVSGPAGYEMIARKQGEVWVPQPFSLGPVGEQVYLVLFGTGLRLRNNLASVQGTVDGLSTPIGFAQAQGDLIGTDQVNLGPLPRALAGRGTVNVTLKVEGRDANTLVVAIQ